MEINIKDFKISDLIGFKQLTDDHYGRGVFAKVVGKEVARLVDLVDCNSTQNVWKDDSDRNEQRSKVKIDYDDYKSDNPK